MGVACDIPAHAYQYSFAENTQWSRFFAPGAEIRQYLVNIVDKYNLRPLMKVCMWAEGQVTGGCLADCGVAPARGHRSTLGRQGWPLGAQGQGLALGHCHQRHGRLCCVRDRTLVQAEMGRHSRPRDIQGDYPPLVRMGCGCRGGRGVTVCRQARGCHWCRRERDPNRARDAEARRQSRQLWSSTE